MDDFSNFPKKITEVRAGKSKSAGDWTPRDALISLLREIDSGKTEDVGSILIIYSRKHGDGRSIDYSIVSDSSLEVLELVTGFTKEFIGE